MLHPTPATDQQSEDQQHHRYHTVVAIQTGIPKVTADSTGQVDRLEVATDQLETSKRRQTSGLKTKPKIAVDPRRKTCFA